MSQIDVLLQYASKVAALVAKVKERQRAVGYEGDYRSWIARVTPPDLQ